MMSTTNIIKRHFRFLYMMHYINYRTSFFISLKKTFFLFFFPACIGFIEWIELTCICHSVTDFLLLTFHFLHLKIFFYILNYFQNNAFIVTCMIHKQYITAKLPRNHYEWRTSQYENEFMYLFISMSKWFDSERTWTTWMRRGI